MADLTRQGRYMQKRSSRAFVVRLSEAEILDGAHVVNLPPRVLIAQAYVIVHTASGTTSASISANCSGTAILTNSPVTTGGTTTTGTVRVYLPTGGAVTVTAGATAPATGSLDVEVVIEYIELDKSVGEYTEITRV